MSIINSSADIVSGPVAAGLPGAGGRRSPLRTAVERFTRSRPFLVGAGTLVAFILAGIIGPHFINDPNATSWSDIPGSYHGGACGSAATRAISSAKSPVTAGSESSASPAQGRRVSVVSPS